MSKSSSATKSPTSDSAKPSGSGPDIRQLQQRDLAEGKFPGDAKSDFRVCIDAKAHERIHRHATENVAVEICGVLVGKWGRDEKGPFLFVSASIPGEAAENKFAEVTFTHDTWSKINATMDKEFASDSIVGWYHTHPDFGIFLSDRDRFIHEHFFNEPGQVALVVDPVRKQEGVFIWSGGKPVPASHYWVGDQIRLPQVLGDGTGQEKRGGSAGGNRTGGSAASAGDRSEQAYDDQPAPLGWITLALGALCCIMIGWLLAGYVTGGQFQRFVEMSTMDRMRVAYDVREIRQSLQEALVPLQSLSISTNQPPEAQLAFRQVAAGLNSTIQQLNNLSARYALDENSIAQLSLMLQERQAELQAMRRQMEPTTAPATNPSQAAAPATAPAAAPPFAAPATAPVAAAAPTTQQSPQPR